MTAKHNGSKKPTGKRRLSVGSSWRARTDGWPQASEGPWR
jgi:hypothetical protein